MRVRAATAAAILSLVLAQPLLADFGSVAGAVERHLGVSRTWMPFLGVARAFVRVAHPSGVHDFQLAMFEGGRSGGGKAIEEVLKSSVGPGYSPMVRVHSTRRDEWSFIYAKPRTDGVVELVIVSHDPGETVVVRVTADADMLMKELNQPGRGARIGRD
jgi:hypothetical protein